MAIGPILSNSRNYPVAGITTNSLFWRGFLNTSPSTRASMSLFGASKVAADVMVQEYGRLFRAEDLLSSGACCLTGPNHSGVELHWLSQLPGSSATSKSLNLQGIWFTKASRSATNNIHSARRCQVSSKPFGAIPALVKFTTLGVAAKTLSASWKRLTGQLRSRARK